MTKRLFCCLMVLLMVMSLVGCHHSGSSVDTGNKSVIYEADWPHYSTVAELVNKGDGVFEGEIVGIHFEVINYQTGKIAQSADEDNLALHTVYEIETSNILKGEAGERKFIKVMGGIVGYQEDAQKAALEKLGLWEDGMQIPVMVESEPLEVGVKYLFVTSNSAGDYLNVVNFDQYAFIAESGGEASDDSRPTYAGIKAYFE